MDNNEGYALDWGDTINEESEFTLLPEGDYDFTVTKFERARHSGSSKLPPCNKAVLTLSVSDGKGNSGTIIHNLFLHKKVEGLLSAFFIAIGQKKHGEPLDMDWNRVTGSKGRCKVFIDEWEGDKGEKKQSNKIKKFYEPDTTQPSSAPGGGFTPGRF